MAALRSELIASETSSMRVGVGEKIEVPLILIGLESGLIKTKRRWKDEDGVEKEQSKWIEQCVCVVRLVRVRFSG